MLKGFRWGMAKAIVIVFVILVAVLSLVCGWLYVELMDRESQIKVISAEVERLRNEARALRIETQRLVALLRNTTHRSVPLYIGNSVHGFIDSVRCLEVYNMIRNYTGIDEGTWIVMFGATYCPHCKAMDAFFSENYPGMYRVLWVDVDQNAQAIFTRLAIAEICSDVVDVASSVPQIVVLRNSTISSIVVGKITNRTFWDQIIEG